MYYQTYSALYTVRTELSWFGAKVGHSRNSIKRVNGFMSNMDLQDLFVLPDLCKNEARRIEDSINKALTEIFDSGGSSEFHVMEIKHFNEVVKLLRNRLGKDVKYQPNAYAVSNDVLFLDGWPHIRALKRNYVKAWLCCSSAKAGEILPRFFFCTL